MVPPARFRESGNRLLDSLPHDEYRELEPRLQRVALATGQVVHDVEYDVDYVHFPTTAILSLLTILRHDDPFESAAIGHDGFVGLAATLGVVASPHRVICHLAGESIRMPLRTFLEALQRGPELSRLLRLYAAYALRDAGQWGACNALHTVEQRACRWLLMAHDRAEGDKFPMTQERLARILGVRRQGVTAAAGALQHVGILAYRRGTVTVRDRMRLEEAACACYAEARAYYGRVMA